MVIDIDKFQFIEQLIFAEKFKSVAHYTLRAKLCILQSKKEKSSKILLLFYNVLKIPMGHTHYRLLFIFTKENQRETTGGVRTKKGG